MTTCHKPIYEWFVAVMHEQRWIHSHILWKLWRLTTEKLSCITFWTEAVSFSVCISRHHAQTWIIAIPRSPRIMESFVQIEIIYCEHLYSNGARFWKTFSNPFHFESAVQLCGIFDRLMWANGFSRIERNYILEFFSHLLYLWFVKMVWKNIFERKLSFPSVNTFNASFTFIFAFEWANYWRIHNVKWKLSFCFAPVWTSVHLLRIRMLTQKKSRRRKNE